MPASEDSHAARRLAIVHYTAPPVVGGVEAVMAAHTRALLGAGYDVTVVAGRGSAGAQPDGAAFIEIPEMDSQHPYIDRLNDHLEVGDLPRYFRRVKDDLVEALAPVLEPFPHTIVHNVFTKHFNLALTAALVDMLDAGRLRGCIAWGHDFTWTSPHSRSHVHDGYPWDLLRTQRDDVTYVVVSQQRQQELAELYGCPPEAIRVIYNGVDAGVLLGLSIQGQQLAQALDLWNADLILLMPVRVTQAKNVEYALGVVAALKERGCRPRLVLTGPPDPHDAGSMAYFRSLQDLRRELGVEEEMRFVFEMGEAPGEGLIIGMDVVADLYRTCDLVFMPSHREGFGMPVLEAGLVGAPVACTRMPAAEEIGAPDVLLFDEKDDAGEVAARLLAWIETSAVHHLRRRVRQNYTWGAILQQIEPLLWE